jgi:hypothetical protein
LLLQNVNSKFFLTHTYCVFLLSWSLGENQSEEHYTTGWGVWGGLAVFVCFTVPVRSLDTESNSQVLPSLPYIIFQTIHFPWINNTMWQHSASLKCLRQICLIVLPSDNWKFQLKAVPSPLFRSAVVFPSEGKASYKKNGL